MDQHLNYFQAQYAPSFDADQAKIDDFGIDSLNTPDINPEFFNPTNLFDKSLVKQVVDVKVDTDSDYLSIFPELTGANSAFDRSATYSPYSKLESAAININSPEMMMPVSPNKVCPQLGYDDLPEQTFGQMSDYESLVNFDYHHNSSSPSTSSQCNSRSSSISAGSDNYLSEYILNPIESATTSSSSHHHHLMTGSSDPTLLCRVPQSPAGSSISSHYSSASSPQHNPKTFTQLETVQQIVIKQEPIDSLYQPTVVEEFEQYHMQPMQQSQQVGAYSTLNTTDLSGASGAYYYTNALPSTVTSAIMSQQMQQQQQQPAPVSVHTPTTPTTPSHSRKRNANSAFSSASHSSSSSSSAPAGSSTKKPRMTKREKQKMMEGDISKYENENRELANSIDLLERQIRFCKKFLSENVAPVIQRQQQQQLGHFGSPSPMVITVEGL